MQAWGKKILSEVKSNALFLPKSLHLFGVKAN